ncbi:hypothetical protein GCM10027430_29250 [Lysobacter tyrosinilyticus]
MPISCQIDFSIFLSDGSAFGNVDGELELPGIPRIGESISFLFPNNGVMPIALPDYPGILRVENVSYAPLALGTSVLLSLEPVTLRTSSDALALCEFLQASYGLYGNPYEA